MKKHLSIILTILFGCVSLYATDPRKIAFERYPLGMICSQAIPCDARAINVDSHFNYSFCSANFNSICRPKYGNMHKDCDHDDEDCPDCETLFKCDARLIQDVSCPRVLAFCEPWSSAGIDSWIYTRKTSFWFYDQLYMLSCFDLVDDMTLGIAKFKRIDYDAHAPLPPTIMMYIPDEWFFEVFNVLPNAMAIVDLDGQVLYANQRWLSLAYQNIVYEVNQQFLAKHLTQENLLTTAAWLSDITMPDGGHYDVGTYGIQDENKIYQVLILRPTMQSAAQPYWHAQLQN